MGKLKKRADGRYACRAGGLWFYGATEKEALEKRRDYQRMLEKGIKEESFGMTVSQYATRWVSVYKANLTNAPYNTIVRMLNRFCEHENIGNRLLRSITAIDVQSFFNTASGMSYSYICDMRDAVRGMFRGAIADRLIDFDPTVKAKLPEGKKGTHRAITDAERELIHRVNHPLRPAVMVMLYAGLRRGEVLALRADRDLDFENMTITVREAVRYEYGHLPTIVDPKTEAGIRTIPMPSVLAQELRFLTGLVAPSAKGDYMSMSAWKSAWASYIAALETETNGICKRWYGRTKAQKEMEDLPPWQEVNIRPHDLRHSFCTMLYEAGIDVKTAQKWMGHADEEMTREIYTHLSEKMENKAKNALEKYEKLLFGSQNGSQGIG